MRRTKTTKPSAGKRQRPDTLPTVPSLESLDEISAWLGTFRERLRLARQEDRPRLDATMKELEIHYQQRRAELS